MDILRGTRNRRMVGRACVGNGEFGSVRSFLKGQLEPISYFHPQTGKHSPPGKVDLHGFPHACSPVRASAFTRLIILKSGTGIRQSGTVHNLQDCDFSTGNIWRPEPFVVLHPPEGCTTWVFRVRTCPVQPDWASPTSPLACTISALPSPKPRMGPCFHYN
jgi:hypothetical protein